MREDLPLFGIPATITRMGCPGIPLSVHWAILSESRRRKSGVNCPMPFPPLQSAAITAAPCFRNQSIHRAVRRLVRDISLLRTTSRGCRRKRVQLRVAAAQRNTGVHHLGNGVDKGQASLDPAAGPGHVPRKPLDILHIVQSQSPLRVCRCAAAAKSGTPPIPRYRPPAPARYPLRGCRGSRSRVHPP